MLNSKNTIIDLVKRGSATAKGGFQNEDDVVRKFKNWKIDIDAQSWLKIMNYDLKIIEKVIAEKIPGSHKTDVQVAITILLKVGLGLENISIKLVTNSSGKNQIDKRKIDQYVKLWNIPPHIAHCLKLFTGEIKPTKENLKDPRRMFFTEMNENDQASIISFFEKNKIMIISDIFQGRDDKLLAAWMLIYIKAENIWSLLPMSQVMNFYGNGTVLITKRGSLHIGKVGLQRKGGDGGRETAKMLQFHIDPSNIVKAIL